MKTIHLVRLGLALLLAALAGPAPGQPLALKVAVIDSDRIVQESQRGRGVIQQLQQLQEAKVAEGRQLQQRIADLRTRIDDGQLSLAPERLEELKKQYEDEVIVFRRFQDDADRELGKARDERLGVVEKDVLEIIDAFGREQGYTLMFNKFRSGLVFANEAVDVTDEIIRRFDAATGE